jgi:hypothetical protein
MRSDVLTSNGVVHVIDSVLLDTKVNASAAISACVLRFSTVSLDIDTDIFLQLSISYFSCCDDVHLDRPGGRRAYYFCWSLKDLSIQMGL